MAFSSDDRERVDDVSRGEAADARQVQLRLKLLSTVVSFTDGREMLDAFRHRYVLAHYVAFTFKLMVLVYLLGLSTERISIVYPAIMIGCASALVAGWAYLALMLRWVWSPDTPGTIQLEPGLIVAAMALAGSVTVVKEVFGGTRDWSFGQAFSLVVLATVWLMLVVAFLMDRTFPRAIARLRRDRERAAMQVPVRKPVPVVPQPAQDVAAAPAPEGGATKPAERAVLASVLRLEASGNYVIVVTERGSKTVPGPFSAVVARMPREAGRQVHRSHWVARHAVTGERRVGRDLRLQTVDGGSVPVSAAQVGAVRVWLAQARAGGGIRP